MITREQEAGELYSQGLKAVQTGGHELHMLAMHLILMVRGTSEFAGPLWPVRRFSDGTERRLDRFIDYLLKQARDGLHLPNLFFLKQTLEATPNHGDEAIRLVRAELKKEHVDFDEEARKAELKMHGERPPLADSPGRIVSSNSDNVTKGTDRGNSATYLAAKLRRDFPDIADKLAQGAFRSVRAAAIAAGIITPPTPAEQITKLLPKLSDDEWSELRDTEDRRRGRPTSAPTSTRPTKQLGLFR